MILKDIPIPKHIILLTGLVLVLSLLRLVFFDSFHFMYLLWNLFLAYVPFAVSLFLLGYARKGKRNKTALIFGLLCWLLLIPNAPYIVTDLIHVMRLSRIPIIYDTFLLYACAWAGLELYFYSLSHIENIVRMRYSIKATGVIMIITTLLISFGIYLGRFLRFNSWDALVNPHFLYKEIVEALQNKEAAVFTLISFVFLVVFYYAWTYRANEGTV